jgi:hypothetical protein
VTSSDDLKEDAASALSQIDEREYKRGLESAVNLVHCFGIAFHRKHVNVQAKSF